MSDDFCPRQITFELPGTPGLLVTATENGTGGIDFVLDVEDTPAMSGDLRALYFHFDETKLEGLQVTGGDGFLTEARVKANSILDLGDGTTMAGAVKTGFDVGIEFGTPGSKPDHLHDPIHFTLSRPAGDLTLDDIAHQLFGARVDAIGGPGGPRGGGAGKLLGTAPAAPDAVDDNLNIFEDGASGLDDPSKSPVAVKLDVLANDTDGDGDSLVITAIHEGPSHGQLEIAADGKSLLYTPDADYSGVDTFEYCVSDGNGGQDHALCTVTIAAVADDPLITIQVTPTDDVNVFSLTVTADQNDADGSESITDLVLANAASLPAGVTISAGVTDPSSTADHLVKVFDVTTAPGTDFAFNIDFTASSEEASNNDTESATQSQNVTINFEHNEDSFSFDAVDQSIWDTGNAFHFHYDEFLGVQYDLGDSGGDPDITGTYYDVGLHFKAGLQVLIDLNGGDINATVPVDVTVDTTYNKTTDQLLVDAGAAIGSGLSFTANSPSGAFKLDVIFELEGHAVAKILYIPLVDLGVDENLSFNVVDLNTNSAGFSLVDPITGSSLTANFPLVTTVNDPGSNSGTGTDTFLTLDLDLDQVAGLGLLADEDPVDPDNFELVDADLIGTLKMYQTFAIDLAGQSVTLVFDEDNTSVALDLTTPLLINGASAHDVNQDGVIDMHFEFNPHVTLSNDTGVQGDLSFYLALLKNAGELGTIYENTFPITDGSFSVFNETFDLAVSGLETMSFAA